MADLTPDRVAELRRLYAQWMDAQSGDAKERARAALTFSLLGSVTALLAAAEERDRLRARLHYECKGCPGCGSNDCPDALDAVRAQRDALVEVLESGQPLRTHDLDMTQRWVIDDVEEVQAAIRAAKEANDG